MSSVPRSSATVTPPTTITGKRLAVGFGWGIVATIVMFIPIIIMMLTGTAASSTHFNGFPPATVVHINQ